MTEKSINSARNERIVYAAVWITVALLPIILELWKLINGSIFEWKHVTMWWNNMIPLIIIFLLHNHILIPKFLKKGKIVVYCIILLLGLTAYGTFQYEVDKQRRIERMEVKARPPGSHSEYGGPPHMLQPKPGRPPGHKPHPHHMHLIFNLMLAAMMFGLNIAISLIFAHSREQANMKELENHRLQEELKYLRQQISPHFLMNILNNIHEMAEEDTKGAQEMILELSHLMRYVLYDSEHDTTTFNAEVRFISSFVSLMRMRYVEDLVKINLDIRGQEEGNIHIPPLLFIPFIENAFKHGVSYSSKSVIDIKLHRMENNIIFSCDNTIPSNKAKTDKGGVGLTNVRRRLELLYGKDYSLDINNTNNIHSVTLIIPYR